MPAPSLCHCFKVATILPLFEHFLGIVMRQVVLFVLLEVVSGTSDNSIAITARGIREC